ncbi:MAG: GyrI-like domain-containing protein [Candidatus Hodarchaeota archaeon]
MEELIVKIVKLKPMRVAYTHAISKTPEKEAWDKLLAWAKPKGYFDQPGKHTTFGYNNPPPAKHDSPRDEEYGYELLINVGPEDESEGEVRLKTIPGGLYAVARVKGVWNIFHTWVYLNDWLAASEYELDEANEPGFEECITPFTHEDEMIFDLYLPIKTK